MKRIWIISMISMIVAFASLNYSFIESEYSVFESENNGPIEWLSMEEAMKRHEKEPKFWIIDTYTDWCGWCKKMDASTFADAIIGQEISKNFYAVKLNAEQKEDIEINGRIYRFIEPTGNQRRGYHELAAELLNGRMSYPTMVYLNDSLQIIQAVPGFQTREDLHPILTFFSSRNYLNTDWETYKNNYVSPYEQQ